MVSAPIGGTALLPCLVQARSAPDAARLVLWFKGWNATGPPIYSVDLRHRFRSGRGGQHFVNSTFVDRLEWPPAIAGGPDAPSAGDSFTKLANESRWRRPAADRSSRLAYLRMRGVQPADLGLFVCRVDFRRGRTQHTLVQLQTFGGFTVFR